MIALGKAAGLNKLVSIMVRLLDNIKQLINHTYVCMYVNINELMNVYIYK